MTTRILSPAACGVLVALGLLAACGSVRRSEAIDGPLELRDAGLVRGREVFFEHCHKCHPGGEPGLGPGLNDKPLPEFLIRFQVRHGLGVMPGFSEREIPASDLDDLVAYLKARRGSS